jgi:hypothetical protein
MKIDDVLSLDIKPKEKMDKISDLVIAEPTRITQVIQNFIKGSDVDKGTYATVLKQVSSSNPEIIEPYLEDLFPYINYKANRVKWGIQETVGNLAEKYPIKVEKAIPYLFENTRDKSTVVRWCAAYALSRIMLYNIGQRDELLKRIEQILIEEKNNGVKNVYLNAVNQIKSQ